MKADAPPPASASNAHPNLIVAYLLIILLVRRIALLSYLGPPSLTGNCQCVMYCNNIPSLFRTNAIELFFLLSWMEAFGGSRGVRLLGRGRWLMLGGDEVIGR